VTAGQVPGPVIRVLVADDQAIVRAGLRMLLSAEPDMDVVGEADDGGAAVRQASVLRPDVVVMDVRMPHMDGVEATGRLVRLDPPPAVLVLTTFGLDEYLFGALRAGAAGFLVKDADPQRLIDAVRAVANGDVVIAPSVTRRLIDAAVAFADLDDGRRRQDTTLDRLTAREQEIFLAVARGLSNADIAARLSVSEHTVKTHIGSLFAKLGLASRVQAVIAAYEWGVIRPGFPDGA
jgi:DNA-binding NarL/FixJ family response regulator